MQEVGRLIQHSVVLLHKLTSDTLRTRLHHHRSANIKHNNELGCHNETTSDTLGTRLHHHRSANIKHNNELGCHNETM